MYYSFSYKAFVRIGEKRKAGLKALEALCNEHDKTHTSMAFTNEGNCEPRMKCIFLCYDKKQLIAAASLFMPDYDCAEASVMVHPDYRRMGVFSTLYEMLLDEAETFDAEELLFVAPANSPAAVKTAEAFNYSVLYSEQLMTLNNAAFEACQKPVPAAKDAENLSFESQTDSSGSGLYCTLSLSGSPIGAASADISASVCCIYTVEVSADYRGRGFGSLLVYNCLALLREKYPCHRIILQVTSSNAAALKLYSKLGFELSEQLDFYSEEI